MKIDKEIIRLKTTSINTESSIAKQYGSCLDSEVEYSIADDLLRIKCRIQTCSYRISFGNVYLCNSPVRIELYRKYYYWYLYETKKGSLLPFF